MPRFQSLGAFFFRFRGQLPFFFVAVLLPLAFGFQMELFPGEFLLHMKVSSMCFIWIGLILRVIVVGFKAPHTSGRNRHEQVAQSLNTTGPYSITQHPLYLGSFLIWIGVSIPMNNLIFFLGTILFSMGFFTMLIREESSFLSEKFGDLYAEWSKRTPVFYVNPFSFIPAKNSFDGIRVLATEYPTWISIIAGLLLTDLLRYFFIQSNDYLLSSIYCWISIGVALGIGGRFFKYVVVLRWLKRSI
jgi:protein-S-isoprenylcysteine O-methyltransferase Ste14